MQVLVYDRDPTTGELTADLAHTIPLQDYADNLEFDHASGNIFVGDVGELTLDPFRYHFDVSARVCRPSVRPTSPLDGHSAASHDVLALLWLPTALSGPASHAPLAAAPLTADR